MVVRVHCKRSKHKKWTWAKNSKIKLSQLGLMLFFPTQNEKKKCPDWPCVLETTDPDDGKPTHF